MALVLAPDSIVAEGAHWTLAVNHNQNLLGKIILVARRPVESVTELDNDEWCDLLHQVRRVCAALDELFQPDRYNHAFLMNLDAQVHLHVVPRYREQRIWDGEVFSDPHFGALFGPSSESSKGVTSHTWPTRSGTRCPETDPLSLAEVVGQRRPAGRRSAVRTSRSTSCG